MAPRNQKKSGVFYSLLTGLLVVSLAFGPSSAFALRAESPEESSKLTELANRIKRFARTLLPPPQPAPVPAAGLSAEAPTAGMEGQVQLTHTIEQAHGTRRGTHIAFRVWDVAFVNPVGFASVGADGAVRSWKASTGKSIRKAFPQVSDTLKAVAIDPSGQQLAYGGNGNVLRLTQPGGDPLSLDDKLAGRVTINSLAFSVDGKQLASGGSDGTVRLWDPENGEWVETIALDRSGGEVPSVAFGPENRFVAFGINSSYDHEVFVWNIQENRVEFSHERHMARVVDVAFTPDGEYVASASNNGFVYLAGMKEGVRGWAQKLKGALHSMAIRPTPEDQILAVADKKGYIHFLSIPKLKVLETVRGGDKSVEGLAFSPNGQILVSASSSGTIRIWDVSKLATPQAGMEGAQALIEEIEALVARGVTAQDAVQVDELFRKGKQLIRGGADERFIDRALFSILNPFSDQLDNLFIELLGSEADTPDLEAMKAVLSLFTQGVNLLVRSEFFDRETSDNLNYGLFYLQTEIENIARQQAETKLLKDKNYISIEPQPAPELALREALRIKHRHSGRIIRFTYARYGVLRGELPYKAPFLRVNMPAGMVPVIGNEVAWSLQRKRGAWNKTRSLIERIGKHQAESDEGFQDVQDEVYLETQPGQSGLKNILFVFGLNEVERISDERFLAAQFENSTKRQVPFDLRIHIGPQDASENKLTLRIADPLNLYEVIQETSLAGLESGALSIREFDHRQDVQLGKWPFTGLNRWPTQMRLLSDVIIPERVGDQDSGLLTLISAPSATGEEGGTILVEALETLDRLGKRFDPEGKDGWGVRVIGIDLEEKFVREAEHRVLTGEGSLRFFEAPESGGERRAREILAVLESHRDRLPSLIEFREENMADGALRDLYAQADVVFVNVPNLEEDPETFRQVSENLSAADGWVLTTELSLALTFGQKSYELSDFGRTLSPSRNSFVRPPPNGVNMIWLEEAPWKDLRLSSVREVVQDVPNSMVVDRLLRQVQMMLLPAWERPGLNKMPHPFQDEEGYLNLLEHARSLAGGNQLERQIHLPARTVGLLVATQRRQDIPERISQEIRQILEESVPTEDLAWIETHFKAGMESGEVELREGETLKLVERESGREFHLILPLDSERIQEGQSVSLDTRGTWHDVVIANKDLNFYRPWFPQLSSQLESREKSRNEPWKPYVRTVSLSQNRRDDSILSNRILIFSTEELRTVLHESATDSFGDFVEKAPLILRLIRATEGLRRGEGHVNLMVEDPQGRYFKPWISSSRKKWMTAGRIEVRPELLGKQDRAVLDGALHPRGDEIVTVGSDQTVRLWGIDRKPGWEKDFSDLPFQPRTVAYSRPTGRYLAFSLQATGDETVSSIQTLNMETGQELPSLKWDQETVRTLAFHPQQEVLLASGSQEGSIRIWDVETQEVKWNLGKLADRVEHLAFSPDGHTLVAALSFGEPPTEGAVHLYNLKEERGTANLIKLNEPPARVLAFTPNGKQLVTGHVDGTLQLWALPSRKRVKSMGGGAVAVQSVALNSKGDLLAAGSKNGVIRLWSLPEGTFLGALVDYRSAVTSLAFHPQENHLISTGKDGRLLIWDVSELQKPQAGLESEPEETAADLPADNLRAGMEQGTLFQEVPEALRSVWTLEQLRTFGEAIREAVSQIRDNTVLFLSKGLFDPQELPDDLMLAGMEMDLRDRIPFWPKERSVDLQIVVAPETAAGLEQLRNLYAGWRIIEVVRKGTQGGFLPIRALPVVVSQALASGKLLFEVQVVRYQEFWQKTFDEVMDAIDYILAA